MLKKWIKASTARHILSMVLKVISKRIKWVNTSKQKMDYDMIEQLAREVHRLDPTNEVLQKFLAMDNFEGAELRKCLQQKK